MDIKTKTPLKAKVKTLATAFVALIALVSLVCPPSLVFGTEAEEVALDAPSSSASVVPDSLVVSQEVSSSVTPINEIFDTVTPLAYGSDVGVTWALLNLICMAFGLLWSAVLLVAFLRGYRKENAKASRNQKITGEAPLVNHRGHLRGCVIVVSLGVVSLVVFLLTEDLTLPMVWVDAFSPLMVLFVIAQDLITLRLLKHENPGEETVPQTPPSIKGHLS
jgi:hypothetical protein